MYLKEICADLIPDNDDKKLVAQLLDDACMNARQNDDEELYFAYVKVIEEYVFCSAVSHMRRSMVDYWRKTHE